MEREIERREREATDKAYLQMELAQLNKNIATEKRQIAMQLFSPPPATAQPDVQADSMTPSAAGALQSAPGDVHTPVTSADSRAHASPPLTADSVNSSTPGTFVQSTAATRDAHSLALSATAPADTQHTTLSKPDSLMTVHPRPLFLSDVVPAPGAIKYPHRQLTDGVLMSAPAPSMTDYVLPRTMSDLTAASSQLGLPRAPSRTPAQPTYCSMYAFDVDHALHIVDSSQF